MNKRQIGTDYEDYAAAYLEQQGYRIVARNYRTRTGEIDVIAQQGEYLCFIEVKYRRSALYGEAAAAVDLRKQRAICKVARYYLTVNGYNEWTPCRFDVAAVMGTPQTGLAVELIQNAFSYQL